MMFATGELCSVTSAHVNAHEKPRLLQRFNQFRFPTEAPDVDDDSPEDE